MSEVRNVPRLRFPGFEGEWKRKKLGTVGNIVNGLTYSPDDIDVEGVLVLRSSNVKDGSLRFDDNVYVKTANYNPVQKGDILICVRNGSRQLIGKNALITSEAEGLAFGAFMSVFRSTQNSFVYQLFSTKKYYKTINENLGATINSINNSDLIKFEFFFPSSIEQNKISSYFSSIDSKKNLLKKKKALIEKYKKAMLEKIFGQQIRFKDANAKDFGGWENRRIGDLAIVTAGATPSTTNEAFWGGDIRWMNSGELNLKRVYEVENRITRRGLDSSSTKKIPAGSVLIGLAGQGKTRGTVAMNMIELCTNQSIASILPDKTKYVSDFLYHNLDSRYYELRELSAGDGGRGGLNLQIIKSMTIYLPTIPEQTKIANFLSAIDDKINFVAVQMEYWKKGLLGEMFV